MGIRFLTIQEESYRDRKDEDARIRWYWRDKNAWFLTDSKEERKEEQLCVQEYGCLCVSTYI